MPREKILVVSHAPFWHNGDAMASRHYHILLAALIPVVAGIMTYGISALEVASLAVSTAVGWELLMNWATRRPVSVGDGNAALTGLVLAMLLPATIPWWAVVTGTLLAIVLVKQIFGVLGARHFNPVLLSMAVLMTAWPRLFDFNHLSAGGMTGFRLVYPLWSAGLAPETIAAFTPQALLLGRQAGGIGSAFGLGIIIGGAYLMVRGYIRWEIVISFLAGVAVTALAFHRSDPAVYAGPLFHLLAGYTLVGAVFCVTADASSPVNRVPMLIYGAGGGVLTVLLRNIDAYVDGLVFAFLVMNLIHPLIDNIRPKAMGKEAGRAKRSK